MRSPECTAAAPQMFEGCAAACSECARGYALTLVHAGSFETLGYAVGRMEGHPLVRTAQR